MTDMLAKLYASKAAASAADEAREPFDLVRERAVNRAAERRPLRAALTAADRPKLPSGADMAALPSTGMILALRTPSEAKLPSAPERAPKEGTFAGFTSFKSAPKAGIYTISLSAGAWVDVVQDGHVLKPKGFSGATDCAGIRKTMKYELAAAPFVLQISGAKEDSISIAILPSE